MASNSKVIEELKKRKKMFIDYLCQIKNTPAGKQDTPKKAIK